MRGREEIAFRDAQRLARFWLKAARSERHPIRKMGHIESAMDWAYEMRGILDDVEAKEKGSSLRGGE